MLRLLFIVFEIISAINAKFTLFYPTEILDNVASASDVNLKRCQALPVSSTQLVLCSTLHSKYLSDISQGIFDDKLEWFALIGNFSTVENFIFVQIESKFSFTFDPTDALYLREYALLNIMKNVPDMLYFYDDFFSIVLPELKTANFGLGFTSFTPYISKYLYSGKLFGGGQLHKFVIRSCRYSYNRSSIDNCASIELVLNNIDDEAKLLDVVSEFCKDEMKAPNKKFFAGYNSLIDCVVMLHGYIMRSGIARLVDVKTMSDHTQPMIQLPYLLKDGEIYGIDEMNENSLQLIQRNSDCSAVDDNWMFKLNDVANKHHSQGAQDGVLLGILAKLGTRNKYFIEIGFNNNKWVDGSNTYLLHISGDWNGLLIDGEFENPQINLYKHFVTPHNILNLLEVYQVPDNPDYISIDIDSQDIGDGYSLNCLF